MIGDFGLMTYPEKNPRTEHGRKLGPTDYMAPEMRQDADRADPGPADVWALGKTLWVLLTGQSLGPPMRRTLSMSGSRSGSPRSLTCYWERPLRSSRSSGCNWRRWPANFRACTGSPPEAQPSPSLAELHARVAALTATSRQRHLAKSYIETLAKHAWTQLDIFCTLAGDTENQSAYRALPA